MGGGLDLRAFVVAAPVNGEHFGAIDNANAVLERLTALRGPSECSSEVILRVVEIETKGQRSWLVLPQAEQTQIFPGGA